MASTCPECGMTSHNPNDEREGFCGNCHKYTGERQHGVKVINMAMEGTILPPPRGVCQLCGRDHDPAQPHDQQNIGYQYRFYQANGGRWPTWADAMAHCAPEVQQDWMTKLRELGVTEAQLGKLPTNLASDLEVGNHLPSEL